MGSVLSLDEILSRTRRTESGCWIWTARQNVRWGMAYGEQTYHQREWLAHRLVYTLAVGPISDGLTLDHLCRETLCVNPAHLEPVTHAENMARSAAAQKTHCINGHPFDQKNTYLRPSSGRRDCRICIAARVRRYQRKAA